MEPIDRAPIMGALTSSEGQAAIKAMTGAEAYNYFLSLFCSAPTIDAIRAAGGCRCGECKWYEANGICGWTSTASTKNLRDEDDFCSDGEPREVQDDG